MRGDLSRGTFEVAACTTTGDTACETCDPSCATCSGSGTSACTSCTSLEPPVAGECLPVCATTPASGCRLPAVAGKAKLIIKDTTTDKDSLKWKWVRGDATTVLDFGDPTDTVGYVLCVYDAGIRVSSTVLPAGGTCAGKPCWTPKKTGFLYKDKLLTPDGALVAKLKAGVAGKASISVSAKGANLETPDPTTFTGPVRVQLQRADAGICFEAVYSAPFKKNAGGKFLDVAD